MSIWDRTRRLAKCWLLPSAFSCGVALAQGGAFTIGEHIEYRDGGYQGAWHRGTIVRLAPASNQVIVRWDPRDDYPAYTHNGVSTYEQGYALDAVRHLGAASGAASDPATAQPTAATSRTSTPMATALGAAGAPLSKREIVDYMRTRAYAGGQPTHDANICRALVDLIKARGVEAPLEVGHDDVAPFADNGCYNAQDTDVVGATRSNLGAPVGLNWLAGTWAMYVLGGTVDFAAGDGWIYRKNETLAKLGVLTIAADGSYVWKVEPGDPPGKYVHGRWRAATLQEMNVQGGAGIVLQNAAEGADWIVFKYMDPSNKAERIEVEHLQSRGAYRRIGWRT